MITNYIILFNSKEQISDRKIQLLQQYLLLISQVYKVAAL